MSSVPNSSYCVKSPSARLLLADRSRLPRQAEDDPYAWLYEVQVNLGAGLPCTVKSVILALWVRACLGHHKIAPGALEQETGLDQPMVQEALRVLTDYRLVSLTWQQSGQGHFYLLPAQHLAANAGR